MDYINKGCGLILNTVPLNKHIKTHQAWRRMSEDLSQEVAEGPWDGEGLCEFWCLHLDRAWTGPRSLTGLQACV